MIINLRGTNGSGKSTVARGLMERRGETVEEIALASYETGRGNPRSVVGYFLKKLDLIVVGRYETACGGCDTIKTQYLTKASVALASSRAKHVFFEGVLASTLFSGYLELSKTLRPARFVWAYLDTPLEVCLARIQARNGGKAINETLVADKVRAIDATRRKAQAAGEVVRAIRYGRALDDVLGVLREKR